MLIISVMIIVGLTVYPDKSPKITERTQNIQSTQRLMKSTNTPLKIPEDTIGFNDSKSKEPVIIQIVSEPQPFNWKELISWIIGGVNGMVLLIMNIKNIRKK